MGPDQLVTMLADWPDLALHEWLPSVSAIDPESCAVE
jgi:hypothetical protein